MLCEGQCLQGRGIGKLDLMAEARYWCDQSVVADKVVCVDQDLLRRVIRRVLTRELPSAQMEFSDRRVLD